MSTAFWYCSCRHPSTPVVYKEDHDALTARFRAEEEAHAQLQGRCFDQGSQSVFDRVRELEAALRDLLGDMGEDVNQRHHRDKYRVYQVSPETMTAARAVLTPAPSRHMTQEERDAMGRALERSQTVIHPGFEPDDPTPWCSGCGAMRKTDCHCGPLADNE
jgi:hypothetical protein